MTSLKVVFFGTPEFAKTTLEAIHHSSHTVLAAVTAPDKGSGRGQKVTPSAVKSFAVQNDIPVLQPEKLKDPSFLQTVENLKADVFVVVAFRMMPKVLFDLPRLGTFNLHASLLPDYRGAAPVNFAIMNGEKTTGATTFFINEKIDEGHVLLQKKLEIGEDENAGELHDRLMTLGAELVLETLDGLAQNNLTPVPQPHVNAPKNAFKIFKNDTLIDWTSTAKNIHDFIRGLSPYPTAFTVLKIGNVEKSLKIYSGQYQTDGTGFNAGELVINKTEFKIYTSDGVYLPAEVQLEGKKRMAVKDFLNGFRSFDDISLKNPG